MPGDRWVIFFDSFDPERDPQWWLEDTQNLDSIFIPMKDEASARRVADERNTA